MKFISSFLQQIMSDPPSPARSNASFAESTHGSPKSTAEQLTPRSKIKALLATVDNDSDDSPPQRRSRDRVKAPGEPAKEPLPSPKATPFEDDGIEKNTDYDEDEDAVLPRGKLARRLYASKQPKQPEDIEDQALNGRNESEHESGHSPSSDKDAMGEQASYVEEDGNEIEKQPRRFGGFLKRKQKSATPLEDEVVRLNAEPTSQAGATQPRSEHVEDVPAAFEVPARKNETTNDSSDSDLPTNLMQNERFMALVARKREERKAREAAEEAKRAERAKRYQAASGTSETDSDDGEKQSDLKLTQASRPTRKASKKAIEEMARETQRISRNMQLAHEAKTRKKITKESLLARFRPKNSPAVTQVQASSSTMNSSAPTSDAECNKNQQTPLTTPEKHQSPKATKQPAPTLVPETSLISPEEGTDMPIANESVSNRRTDKGKGKDPTHYSSEPLTVMAGNVTVAKKPTFTQRPIKLRPPKNPVAPTGYRAESDSDLEIVSTKQGPEKSTIFDKLPTKQAKDDKSLIRLRALAHLSSPGKQQRKSGKAFITPTELGSALRQQARQQAARERAEKIEELRRKGVVIQTAEERQQDQLAVEDMIEKARLEAEQLAEKEKEEVKKERKENGEEGVFDSSDDEDYEDNEEQHDDDASVELSGSEEEGNEGDEEDEDEDEEEDEIEDEASDVEKGADGLVDDIASEDEEEEQEDRTEDAEDAQAESGAALDDKSDDDLNVLQVSRRRKIARVIEDEDEETPAVPKPSAISRSPVPENPFGQAADANAAPMGLTQAFAATMADSQLNPEPEEDSLTALGALTAPDFPDIEMDSVVRDSFVRDSPINEEQAPDIDLHLTQTQIQPDSVPLERAVMPTQFSQIPDPSQDEGFDRSSPINSRFAAPPSTVDTVIVPPKEVLASPALKKKGRLRRKVEAVAVFSDEENNAESAVEADEKGSVENGFSIAADAFDVLKKGSKKTKKREEQFDKKKSEAKGMVEEQAIESEDEYAGLGGASDDSEGEVDEEVKRMIDEGHVNVNERKIAAYFA